MPSLIPRVPIELDRPRQLVLDYAALQAMEEATGIPYYELFTENRRFSATELVAIVWACLLDDDPDLTRAAVAKMLGPGVLPVILEALAKLLTLSTPESEGEASRNGAVVNPNPQRPETTGSSSGPSPAMTSVLARENFGS